MKKSDRIIVAPSILSADFAALGTQVQQAEESGADWLHVDVMDGHFVPNLTIGPVVVKAVRRSTSLFLDVHLMVSQPSDWVQPFADAGADRISLHIETGDEVNKSLNAIQALELKAGIAISPDTPISELTNALPMVDLVLMMSVFPGFGGQEFIPSTIDRIIKLSHLIEAYEHPPLIAVDGGINALTGRQVVEAGASVLIAGSYIFANDQNIAERIQSLRY